MNGRVTIVSTLVCTLLCVTGSAASVFKADQLISTSGKLGERGCLPDDYDDSATLPAATACFIEVTEGTLPSECQQAPVLPQFYSCYSSSRSLLNANATMFDIAQLKENLGNDTSDQIWVNKARNMVDGCEQDAEPVLTAPRMACYTFMCLKWNLFSDCDHQQEVNGSLDEEGKLRQVRFLKGNCSLSPNSLKDVLEEITNRTLAECSTDLYTGDNATQLHDGQVSRVVCLLENFIDDCGNDIQLDDLKEAIEDLGSANGESAGLLLDILVECDSNKDAEAFVRCWASYGVSQCASEEANEVASQFPDDCVISVDLD